MVDPVVATEGPFTRQSQSNDRAHDSVLGSTGVSLAYSRMDARGGYNTRHVLGGGLMSIHPPSACSRDCA